MLGGGVLGKLYVDLETSTLQGWLSLGTSNGSHKGTSGTNAPPSPTLTWKLPGPFERPGDPFGYGSKLNHQDIRKSWSMFPLTVAIWGMFFDQPFTVLPAVSLDPSGCWQSCSPRHWMPNDETWLDSPVEPMEQPHLRCPQSGGEKKKNKKRPRLAVPHNLIHLPREAVQHHTTPGLV